MDTLFQDLRYAIRILIKKPGFVLVAVFTLALGIGANTAIFSVVNAVLFRPLPYTEPDRLVVALHGGTSPVSPADFNDWREQNQVFEEMAAAEMWGPNLTGREQPEQLQAVRATDNLFTMLGVQPRLGRAFLPGDDDLQAAPVVVLSHRLWQRRFGGDPGIIGQTLTLDGVSYTVVGVMPEGFEFPLFWATKAEMWAPLPLGNRLNSRGGRSLRVFARLKPGVSRETAQVEMDAIAQRIAQAYPESHTENGVRVVPLHQKIVGDARPALLVLLGAVAFVLAVACANVANLMLVRAGARRREIAVRLALGAARFRLVRQLLTEGLLLSLLGGGAGLLLALWGVRSFVAGMPEDILPRQQVIGIDGGVLWFTLLLSLITGVLFSLVPALKASKPDLNETLKESSRQSQSGGGLRSLLVIAEIALALVLLTGAGLMIRSFAGLRAIDPGFDAENLLTMKVSVAGTNHSPGPRREAFFRRLIERIESLPGVRSASAINHLPLAGDRWGRSFSMEGQPPTTPAARPRAAYRVAQPGYFRTMGIALRGRDFDERDDLNAPGAVIVNEALALRYWPGEEAIGKRIKIGALESDDPWLSVVGVARDVKQEEWSQEAESEIYLPYRQEASYLTNPAPHFSYLTLVVRTASDATSLAPSVRREVWAIEKDAPISSIATMEDVIAEQLWQARFSMLLLGLFAGVSMMLAGIGIYGVMSYSVAQRTHEIGIRMALGAGRSDILRMVIKQGITLAIAGVLIGLAAAFALTRVMEGLLYGVSATDPMTFSSIALLLVTVAIAACIIPARRAMRVDPMVALRYE
ncbi:MAG: ABC transporter permease [Blastocatellia bacterium]|nr:ABC transporter permease [Blastocatellia bacterium]